LTIPERIDFTKIIADIEAAGITIYKISLLTHRQFKQVQRWKAGSEPRHVEGQMLLEIHKSCVTGVTK